MQNAQYWINKLELNPHPERGYFSEIYRSNQRIQNENQQQRYLFTLVSCMVSPGFDFQDFKIFKKDELILQYPNYQSIIKRLTP